MNDRQLQALIQRDRQAPLPEGPDPRWIAARVRLRLSEPARPELGTEAILVLVIGVVGALIPTVWALLAGQPAWLLLWPALLLVTAPMLGKNGANQP